MAKYVVLKFEDDKDAEEYVWVYRDRTSVLVPYGDPLPADVIAVLSSDRIIQFPNGYELKDGVMYG